jgi:predicted DNA binding CopG/RHH family protein
MGRPKVNSLDKKVPISASISARLKAQLKREARKRGMVYSHFIEVVLAERGAK